ncbi:Rieske 2Fe-2S domain-containing protein [Streptomyces stramineus]
MSVLRPRPSAPASPPAPGPPDFTAARSKREKVRAAGLDPDYWYPVAHDRDVAAGRVVETRFWGRSIAVHRGDDGTLHAVENRCDHSRLQGAGAVGGRPSGAPAGARPTPAPPYPAPTTTIPTPAAARTASPWPPGTA